jgi:D-arabinose 1-dehydrogenase-like Zn-dependent alcohol dehydrogenase
VGWAPWGAFFPLESYLFIVEMVSAKAQPRSMARPQDEAFVRGLGADFTDQANPGWDAVADAAAAAAAAALQHEALTLLRDGGTFIGVQPGNEPTIERGIRVTAVITHPDGARLCDLLSQAATGTLPTRVHAVLPLEQAGDAHRAMAKGGLRGRIVLTPRPLDVQIFQPQSSAIVRAPCS